MEYHLSHAMIFRALIRRRIWLWQRSWPSRRSVPPGEWRPLRRMQRLCEGRGRQPSDIAVYGGKGGSRSFHVEEVRQIRDSAAVMPSPQRGPGQGLYPGWTDHMTDRPKRLAKRCWRSRRPTIFLLTCGAASSLLPTVRSGRRFSASKGGQSSDGRKARRFAGGKHGQGRSIRQRYDWFSKTGTLTKR